MNNLIVAIIAIALTAAVAGMGIWFGGQAYQQYSINAYAAQTIQTMNEIKSAAAAWQDDNPGQNCPLTDPVTSHNFASCDPVAWGDTLTYNQKPYLETPFSSAYSSFNINYGTHGNLTDWSNSPGPSSGTAHFGSAQLYITPDAAGNNWLVWYLDMGSPAGTNGVPDVIFYGQICAAINSQSGQIPYASNLTINNSNYNSGSVPIGLPYSAAGTYIQNLCTVAPNSGSAQYFTFAMPL